MIESDLLSPGEQVSISNIHGSMRDSLEQSQYLSHTHRQWLRVMTSLRERDTRRSNRRPVSRCHLIHLHVCVCVCVRGKEGEQDGSKRRRGLQPKIGQGRGQSWRREHLTPGVQSTRNFAVASSPLYAQRSRRQIVNKSSHAQK